MSDHIDLHLEEVSVLEAFLQLKADLGLEQSRFSIEKFDQIPELILKITEVDSHSDPVREWAFVRSVFNEKQIALYVSAGDTRETIISLVGFSYNGGRKWGFYPMHGPHRTGFTKFRSLPRQSQLRILKNAWAKRH